MGVEKVALITGSGRGIGRAIAVALAGLGWAVAINDVGSIELPAETLDLVLRAGGAGKIVLADIARSADRARLVEETLQTFGRIDALVNNAGLAPRQRRDILEISEASYDEVMAVNLKGPFFLTQIVAARMLELLERGAITRPMVINIGSISAFTSSVSRPEYCLSKAGVAMMTLLYADRLAEAGIGVYEIRPGIIQTPMTEKVREKYDRLIAGGLTPIKRWGQPEDVAQAVLAIVQGYLPFSTGEVINVDGGFHIQRL